MTNMSNDREALLAEKSRLERELMVAEVMLWVMVVGAWAVFMFLAFSL